MVTFVCKLQPRAGQFFGGTIGGVNARILPSAARHVVGRALRARTDALLSKRLLFLTFSLVFGRIWYSSINSARWTRAGRIQIIECLDGQNVGKIHLNSGNELRR